MKALDAFTNAGRFRGLYLEHLNGQPFVGYGLPFDGRLDYQVHDACLNVKPILNWVNC